MRALVTSFTSLALAALLILPANGANAQSMSLPEAVKKNPGRSVEWLMEATGAPEEKVVAELIANSRVPVSPDKFDEVWNKLTEWEKPLFITIVAGTVVEVHSRIPKGSYGQGFFNLDSTDGLSGHFQPKNVAAIQIIEEPSREGGVARQVAFFDKDGKRIFGIFVNRDVSGGQHDPKTLEQFQAMNAYYKTQATK
ncbi:MAG: ChuX/HutX family heme-like substrate-binding protein [Rhodospirillaceae bacterium]|nr:ChuX/HutX family heme-like substrate-binding protein [Rhodospirillaceae bacterium]